MPATRAALASSALLPQLDAFRTAAQKVQFLRLSQWLKEGHNPEINADKQELVSRMTQLGFRPDIAGSLEDLDRKILAAGSAFDFNSCMDQARTIYEETVEDAAKASNADIAMMARQFDQRPRDVSWASDLHPAS